MRVWPRRVLVRWRDQAHGHDAVAVVGLVDTGARAGASRVLGARVRSVYRGCRSGWLAGRFAGIAGAVIGSSLRWSMLMTATVLVAAVAGAQPSVTATSSVNAPSDGPLAAAGERNAVPRKASKPDRKSPEEVTFEAGHVELQGAFSPLRLSKGVELTVHRYRVTADQLTLERSATGLQVAGDGSISFCPCANSPLAVGFSHATVAPPTDLFLKSATFRACGIPVFWLPAFWVRSPNRSGVMSPRLSYRGSDGLFVGTALHLPLSKRVEPSPEFIDFAIGSYGIQGVDLGAQLVTVNTLSRLRWDYLEHGFFELDAMGHRALGGATSGSWRMDALRGRRARTGYVDFEASSRSYDHSRAEMLFADGRYLLGAGFHQTALRGTALREPGTWGPQARFGVGSAVFDIGQVDTSVVTTGVLTDASSIEPLALHSSSLRLDARPGPFAVKGALRESWLLHNRGVQAKNRGIIGSEAQVSLPLLRAFGQSDSPWTHWLEPQLIATAAVERVQSPAYEAGNDLPVSLQVGLLNVLGRSRGTNTNSLLLRGGATRQRDLQSAMAARWLTSGDWLNLGATVGVVEPLDSAKRAWLSQVRGRVGRPNSILVGARLEGRSVGEPTSVRWLLDEGFSSVLSHWYSEPGWTLGVELEVGLLDRTAFLAGSTVDLETEAPLSHRLGAAYRHPCGCLAVSSLAGWRVGREGLDVTLLVDLMP